MISIQAWRRLALLVGTLLPTACGGGGGSNPPPVPASLTFASSSVGLQIGLTSTQAAMAAGVSGGPAPTGAITYTSSAPAVASVDSGTGAVKAISAGTTTISATIAADSHYASASASYALTVRLPGQGRPLALSGQVTTVAGSATTFVEVDGSSQVASFNVATGVATDGANLYVTDYRGGTIRKIVIATGAVTTLAGSGNAAEVDGIGTAASFNGPVGIAIVGSDLYVTDQDGATIRQVAIATGAVTTLAGSGSTGWADGAGRAATFSMPAGIATDGSNLYVADSGNCRIRRITIAGANVSTFSGAPGFPDCNEVDGGAGSATFHLPYGIAIGGGNLYVADTDSGSANDGGTIRQIVISTGAVTTLAGSRAHGGTAVDGVGSAAIFDVPHGIAVSGNKLFVTDAEALRQVSIPTGAVTTLAGNSNAGGERDGVGAAAMFLAPNGIVAAGGTLVVGDSGAIRTVALAGAAVATLAGGGNGVVDVDGVGAAATLFGPVAVATDGTNLYVADSTTNKIRRIVIATGAVATLAGSGLALEADGTGAAASFDSPAGITTDGTDLYVADSGGDTLRQVVIATGVVTTLAGSGAAAEIDGSGRGAAFDQPMGVATDGANVYVADEAGRTLRQVVIATGAVTTLAGSGQTAETDGIGRAASFDGPIGVVTDGVDLYVTDTYGSWIRKVVIASGAVTTLPNTSPVGPNRNSPGLAGIATDGTDLYVCEPSFGLVTQIVIATGAVTTLAGSGNAAEVDGAGASASFDGPAGIATDGHALYVSDRDGNRIRKID
ncbi:MAG: Ig-like domain-containing protein [Burkholderiales bacterium]|nr:Ig-like domain-containing protein [Burkholderiales bacterium]